MGRILILLRLVYHIVIAPILWLASLLAALFFPFEGDPKHSGLTLLFALAIGIGLIFLVIELI